LHQLNHTETICTLLRTPTPHHSIFAGRMLFLAPSQLCQSTEGRCDELTEKRAAAAAAAAVSLLYAGLRHKAHRDQFWTTNRPIDGYHPVGAPHAYVNRRPILVFVLQKYPCLTTIRGPCSRPVFTAHLHGPCSLPHFHLSSKSCNLTRGTSAEWLSTPR